MCKQESWQKYVNSINSTISNKVIFKKINSLRSKATIANTTINYNNAIITDPQIKANLFADYFASVFNAQIPDLVAHNNMYFQIQSKILQNDDLEYNSIFKIHELENALAQLKNTSPGLDEIHNLFVKNVSSQYAIELLKLYNRCWCEEQVPADWKIGLVYPILKPKK